MSTTTAPLAPSTELSAKITRALAASEGYVALTAADERVLSDLAKSGDEQAGWALVMANLNFVRSIASRYVRDEVDLEDLVSEGVVGLREAVARFDADRGIKFITYGVWWVKRAVLSHLRRLGHPVHVPKYKHREMHEVSRVRRELAQSLGRSPSASEIAKAGRFDVRLVEECLALSCRAEELDSPAGEGAKRLRCGEASAEDSAAAAEATERLASFLPILSEREAHVLRHRFGLEDAEEQTLTELGDELGVTKERVRQIETLACTRLRAALAGETIPPAPAVRPRRLVRCA